MASKRTPKKSKHEPVYLTKAEASKTRERKQVIADREFARMLEEHGTVTTDLLLTEAAKPSSPLHPFFEWDDTVAAQKYREAQAYALIMASKMVLVLEAQESGPPKVAHSERVEVRALVAPFRNEGFKMRKEALDDKAMRHALIERKIGVLRSWLRETADIEELAGLREAIMTELDALSAAA